MPGIQSGSRFSPEVGGSRSQTMIGLIGAWMQLLHPTDPGVNEFIEANVSEMRLWAQDLRDQDAVQLYARANQEGKFLVVFFPSEK